MERWTPNTPPGSQAQSGVPESTALPTCPAQTTAGCHAQFWKWHFKGTLTSMHKQREIHSKTTLVRKESTRKDGAEPTNTFVRDCWLLTKSGSSSGTHSQTTFSSCPWSPVQPRTELQLMEYGWERCNAPPVPAPKNPPCSFPSHGLLLKKAEPQNGRSPEL